jgi:hypothetical protein
LIPAKGIVNININSGSQNTLWDDHDITIDFSYIYEKQLESYDISVYEYNTKKKKFNNEIKLNDKFPGEHSPIKNSINLGKLKAGIYIVELKSTPMDININGDFASDFLNVSETRGKLLMNLYYDENSNGLRDQSEGLSERSFHIEKFNDSQFECERATNESGMLLIQLGVGNYTLEQIQKNGWKVIGVERIFFSIKKNETTNVELKNEPTPKTFGFIEKNINKILLILLLISLILCILYATSESNYLYILVKLLVMLILYIIILKFITFLNLDIYEDYIIMIVGAIIIAPVLHKISEILIVEILVKYAVGSAIASVVYYLNMIEDIVNPESILPPILDITICVILSILVGLIAEIIYHKIKDRLKNEKRAKILFICTLLLLALIVKPEQHSEIEPKILSFVADMPNPEKDSTIILTAKISNPSNINILYRFFLNDKPLTDWIRQNQFKWSVGKSDLQDAKMEVRIKDERTIGDDQIDSKHIDVNSLYVG